MVKCIIFFCLGDLPGKVTLRFSFSFLSFLFLYFCTHSLSFIFLRSFDLIYSSSRLICAPREHTLSQRSFTIFPLLHFLINPQSSYVGIELDVAIPPASKHFPWLLFVLSIFPFCSVHKFLLAAVLFVIRHVVERIGRRLSVRGRGEGTHL